MKYFQLASGKIAGFTADGAQDASITPDMTPITEAQMRVLTAVPFVVPSSMSMKQARLALLSAGLLDKVESTISGMSKSAQIAWEFSTQVDRTDALTQSLAELLGLSSADVDALFSSGIHL